MSDAAQHLESRRPGKAPRRFAASKRWCAVFVLAVVVRGCFLLLAADNLHADPDAYRKLAETLRRTGILGQAEEGARREAAGGSQETGSDPVRPTAFRPPLYPFVLAMLAPRGTVTTGAIAALHGILGVATVLLVYRLATQWNMGDWGLLAAVLTTCDPILLNQSTLVMTETLATFLAVAALACLTAVGWRNTSSGGTIELAAFDTREPPQRRSTAAALAAGMTIGLAVLCRPTFLPWLALVILASLDWRRLVWHAMPRWRCCLGGKPGVSAGEAAGRAWLVPLWILVGSAIVLAPWGLRNWRAMGVAKVTTTHGGYTVLLGNNPAFYDYLRNGTGKGAGDVWDSAEFDRQWLELRNRDSSSELADDRLAYSLARRHIVEQPEMFAYSSLDRVARLWRLVPHQLSEPESAGRRAARWLVGGWYAVLFLLAAMGGIRLRDRLLRHPWLWGVLLCLTFTGVHAVYWSNMRMRAPLMPYVCLLAAAGSGWIAARLRSRN